MNANLEQLRTRIDSMSLRERALLFLALMVVLFMLWTNALMEPLEARRKVMLDQLNAAHNEVTRLNGQIEEVVQRGRQDPNAALRTEMAGLQSRIDKLETRIGGAMNSLIAPRDMVRVLEDVLTRKTGLKTVRIENLGAVPLVPAGKGATGNLYRHRLRLTFDGTYLEAVDYLKALQALPWKFLWDGIIVDAHEYPHTRITITVSTLGLKEGWIGV